MVKDVFNTSINDSNYSHLYIYSTFIFIIYFQFYLYFPGSFMFYPVGWRVIALMSACDSGPIYLRLWQVGHMPMSAL